MKGVHCGKNPERISIIVDTTDSNDVLYIWNMKINAEVYSIDVGKKYEIIFDSKGEVIVANEQNCLLDGTYIEVFDVNAKSIKTP